MAMNERKSWAIVHDSGTRLMVREFGRYVRDHVRTAAFSKAISQSVRPGDLVVDVGAGFGLLSFLALRAGARHVIAIEQLPAVAALARDLARDNSLADHITFLVANSREVELGEPADVLIAELIGQFGLDEFIVGYMADGRRRFLRPGGRCIPRRLDLLVAPASLPGLRSLQREAYGGRWDDVAGFNLRRLRDVVRNNDALPYIVHHWSANDALLGRAQIAHVVDLSADGAEALSAFHARLDFEIRRSGTVDGLVGWFEVELADGVWLSTSPSSPCTHWGQVVFLLAAPRAVKPGDHIGVHLGIDTRGRWSYAVGWD
jgi:protein arginine N-methyltransferase 1